MRHSRAYARIDPGVEHAVFRNDRHGRPLSIGQTSARPLRAEGMDRQQNNARKTCGTTRRPNTARRPAMRAPDETRNKEVRSFRTRLFTAIMIIVATLTALGFYLAQRRITADAERNLQETFKTELSSIHNLEELRHAALADRCNALAGKPRIHAAIEDDAIDLLYPSAKDELRDLMEGDEPPPEQAARWLHARFYRFLDGTGGVIEPSNPYGVGTLDPETEAQLTLNKLPDTQQIGYMQENTQAVGGA